MECVYRSLRKKTKQKKRIKWRTTTDAVKNASFVIDTIQCKKSIFFSFHSIIQTQTYTQTSASMWLKANWNLIWIKGDRTDGRVKIEIEMVLKLEMKLDVKIGWKLKMVTLSRFVGHAVCLSRCFLYPSDLNQMWWLMNSFHISI